MKKNYLKIISRLLALLTSILFSFILFLLLFNISSIFNPFFIFILITTFFIFIISMYHFFTGKYRKLFLFILFITLTVIILDKNGHLNKEVFKQKISNNIKAQLKVSNGTEIDLSKVIKSNFERVCVFGPYSQNKGVENLLGFKWNIEAKTSIHLDDGHNVLVFIKDNHVIDYVKHPRNLGDFSNFSGQCFDKFNSKFIRKYPKKEWMHDNIYSPNK